MSAGVNDVVQVQFTVGDEDRAAALVTRLLDARLIACGQVLGPVTSRYWWRGSVEEASEWLCLCKTTNAKVDDIVSVICADHPDDVPEVIVLPVIGGHQDYLSWVRAETGAGQ